MARISPDQDVVTLINVFTVDAEHQEDLARLLIEATETTMSGCSGYVSANIHKSLDGTKVTNYAQWRSREHFEAMLSDPVARAHMTEAGELASGFEPQLYEVVFSDG